MCPASKEHKVRIFSHGGSARVEPGHLIVRHNDIVEFVAINTEASLFFPLDGVVEEEEARAGDRYCDLRLERGKNSHLARYRVISKSAGVFPYCVYCQSSNDFAEGHSPPMMIVEH